MKLSILLYGLSILLKLASKKNMSIKKRCMDKNATLLIRTKDGNTARSFIFLNGKIFSKGGNTSCFDAALVWKDAPKAFKTLTSGYDGDFIKDLNNGDLVIEGDPGLVFWFSSTLREIKDGCSR